MKRNSLTLIVLTAVAGAFASCDDSHPAEPMKPVVNSGGSGGEGGAPQLPCDKYGGVDAIAEIAHDDVVPALMNACELEPFFDTLSGDEKVRFADCMAVELEVLFECAGVSYAGAKASNGLECQSLSDAHQGLGISAGDFSAFGRAFVQGLRAGGVDQQDIDAIGAKLLSLEPQIVSDGGGDAGPSRDGGCPSSDAGDAGDAGGSGGEAGQTGSDGG